MRLGLLIMLWLCLHYVCAQTFRVKKHLVLTQNSFVLDSFLIVNGSLEITTNNQKLAPNVNYLFNYNTSTFTNINIPAGSVLEFSYTPIYVKLNTTYRNKHDSIIQPDFIAGINPFKLNSNTRNNPFIATDGLDVTGSIMRGLSIGTNQNAVVNANLNLQFAGKINNDINVIAAISDDNNPIQPEGNTQELQDFDKVFIQFSKDKHNVTVGDFLMETNNRDYFMKFYKKSRGLQAASEFEVNKKYKINISANAALSRGRFVRNVINGVEGNQGPYRLTGPNGELFIIIISGTEAVYIDGERLKRGEQYDYVIDYNTGEITFTAKKVITAYSRIVVEFQYSDRNFARTLFQISNAVTYKKATFYLNYFNESDNKNQPFQQQLTDSAKKILANVGDNLQQAVIASAIQVPFSAGKVLYKKIDTINYTNIFVHAPVQGSDSVFYEVRFSFVGSNRGNYKQSASSANGRVFTWVEPINGIPQGDFEPITPIIAPNKIEMLTIGSTIALNNNNSISVEAVRSVNDKNLFSNIDKQNDVGYGLKLGIDNKTPIVGEKITLQNIINYEWVDKNFRFIERYRSVEFDRIWNRQLTNIAPNNDTGFNEHIANIASTLQWGSSFAYYKLGIYNRNNNAVNGLLQQAGTNIISGKNEIKLKGEWLKTSGIITNQTHLYHVLAGRHFGKWFAHINATREQSSFITDTLMPGSFSYYAYGTSVRNTDSANFKFFTNYQFRLDKLPRNNEFANQTESHEVVSGFSKLQHNLNRFNADFTYRQLAILQQVSPGNLPLEQTFLTRVEYDYGFFKRVISLNTYLAFGSGNELRRDFQFFKVPQGQGIYVWRDFNEDGIQQLNEFVIASFADRPLADYIKIILPSTSIIRTANTQFSQTINFNSPAKWQRSTGIKKAISYFNNQFAVRLDDKSLAENINVTKFLTRNFNDTELIASNYVFRNTLFFNRAHPVYGADFTISNNRNKNLLTNGFESKNRQEYNINLRWNVNTRVTINNTINNGFRAAGSEFFAANNYNYTFNEYKPKLIYQYNNSIRFTINYTYFEAFNKEIFGNEKSYIQEGGIEARFTLNNLGVLTFRYSLYNIKFNGNATSAVAYDMLQGLNTGANQLWNINLQQRLGNNLQININYDGRKAEGIDMIHVGRMEARYLF